MRILHVVTAFPRSRDDVISPWLVEMLKRLQARGHVVEVLTSGCKGGGGNVFAGIPVHRFRYFFARGEDLTHDEGAADRMQRSLRHKVLPAFYVSAGLWAVWRPRGHDLVRYRTALGEEFPAPAQGLRPLGAPHGRSDGSDLLRDGA